MITSEDKHIRCTFPSAGVVEQIKTSLLKNGYQEGLDFSDDNVDYMLKISDAVLSDNKMSRVIKLSGGSPIYR